VRAALKHKEYKKGLQALERAAAATQGDVHVNDSTWAFRLPAAPRPVHIASDSAAEIEGAKAKVAAEMAAAEMAAAEMAAAEMAAAEMAGEVTPRRRRAAEENAAAAKRAAAERAGAVAAAAAAAEAAAAAAASVAESSDPRLAALMAKVAAEAAWDVRLKGTTRADAARVLADQGGHVGRAFHELRLDPAARARVRSSLYGGERTSMAEREAARKAASESEAAGSVVINSAAEEAAAEQAGAAKATGAVQATAPKGSVNAARSVKAASPKGSRLISFMRKADASTFV
jgi:hypothetical protein